MFKKTFFLCLLVSMPAFSAEEMPEIVVSASRIAVPEKEVGGSVTIITSEEIEQRKPITIADALRPVPGLAISQQGPLGAFTQIRVRGAEANHVLVLIDGVEANDPAQGSEFNFAHLSPTAIERIEVLRGPQSSIWGSDALAGVINIITKKGEGKTEFFTTTEFGSNNSFQSTFQLSGANKKTNYSLHTAFLDTDGNNISEIGSERDGYDNTTIRFKGSHYFNDNIQMGLNISNTDASNEFDNGAFGAPIDAGNVTDTDQLYARSFLKVSTFNNLWDHEFSASITDTRNQNSDTNGDTRTEGEKIKLDYQSNFNFETNWITNAEHNFILLIEKEDERFRQRGEVLVSFFDPTLTFDPNQTQDITNYGYVAEYRLGLADRFFVSVALRKDENDEFRDRDTVRFTTSYLFPEFGTKIRAAYGTGVKNPSFTERFGFFPGSFIGNPDLRPETSEAWEFGIDQALFNDTTQLGFTMFWEDLKNEISFLGENMRGRSERNGVEAYFDSQLTSQLFISGSYTYTDSTQADDMGTQQNEIRVPNNTASLNLNYSFLANKANLNLEANYVDEQDDLDFSTFPAGDVELDDYTLVNITASYNFNDSMQAYARIDNLLDDEYQDVFGFETLGQVIYAGLKLKL